MPLYDYKCKACKLEFESIEKTDTQIIACGKCGGFALRMFPKKSPIHELKYDPKKDICDWDGNTSQFYRLYNEAKDRGEKVRLPEQGE
jgi:putative FmdB family regulatory protein